MQPRMFYDDASWEKSEEIADSWVRQFLDPDILTPVGSFLVRGILDPDISEKRLEALYGELAGVLLQLSTLSMPRIGSLDQLLSSTFDTASSYFQALGELHLSHLINQRNDAIDSADGCRRKFVARSLFLKLARAHRLTGQWPGFENGPFRIWCDDFRPANVLLDEDLKIAGVVDWEFTYAAPVEFSYAPPWWLLIEKPEYWSLGLDDWCTQYERRLQTFLRAMIRREDEAIQLGQLEESQRLSGPMRTSWESGDFWIAYAARNNFAFDAIYWEKIDQRFFGPTESPLDDVWQQRVDLLDDAEKDEMEKLVTVKLGELETRVLAWDPDEYTLGHIHATATGNVEDNLGIPT